MSGKPGGLSRIGRAVDKVGLSVGASGAFQGDSREAFHRIQWLAPRVAVEQNFPQSFADIQDCQAAESKAPAIRFVYRDNLAALGKH